MLIDLTPDQYLLRDELRTYFRSCLTPAQRAQISADPFGDAYLEHCRRLGGDGKLGVGWPIEYGGRGLGPLEQQIFMNEIARAGVPYPLVTVGTVGPTLMQYGSQEQKDFFLPRMLAGELHFAIGYTEPEAGTDLASLRTTAVLDGDHYLVNGQKVFTTGAHRADHIWLATRTDPDARKHRGITMMIARCDDPGFSWTPIRTSDGRHHTNATYYQDVRVPVNMVVGEVGKGWDLIVDQLNHERVSLGPAGNLGRLYDQFRAWAERTGKLGEPDVGRALARLFAAFRTNELLNWQVAANMDLGWLGAPDASATKIYSSERMQEAGRLVGDVLARYADPADPETAVFMAGLDSSVKGALVLTFGGGVNEVQRELITMLGLNLPRPPR